MLYKRGQIGTFDLGRNGSEKYDVVYLGGLFQNFIDSEVYELLFNEYVFLFSTRLDTRKDSEVYGHVNIDLVRHDQFSYFNYHFRDKANYYVVEKEPIIINDFLEIIPKETEQGIQVIAHLKRQNTTSSIGKSIKNYQVLLMRANDSRFANLLKLELGPEFQAKVEHDKATEHLYKLLDCSSLLSNLANRNKGNSTEGNAFAIVLESLNKEIENAKKKNEQAFNNYLAYRRSLEYINKV